ncbi:MAG: tannase/feruloyl esterase family alpha/beta hydrolase [Terriglobia bacterium]
MRSSNSVGHSRRVRLAAVTVGALAFCGWWGPAPAAWAAAPAATSCESLATLSLPHTTITLAKSVPAGEFTPPPPPNAPAGYSEAPLENLPGFCRVAATASPSSDSIIKFEVWMPATDWNGRFQAVGNGGWAGRISYGGLGAALQHHYATASTDTGHEGGDARFAIGHPEKMIDFGYRAIHETTVQAKAIIAAYYGAGPRWSYWNGCSTGGRQGLMEAQRFPRDYHGIAAGAPAAYRTHLLFASMWIAKATLEDPASYIPPSKYPLIHAAALQACDALDGVADGIIDDPTRCHFDPAVLTCRGSDAPDCLTPAQVEAARLIYSSATNPRTGEQIFPALEPGSELGWRDHAGGPQPRDISASYFRDVLFKNPQWDFRNIDFDADVTLADQEDRGVNNAINPDLGPFQLAGGKLLLYHGWSDNLIAPLGTVNYYQDVVATMGGAEQTASFARLFMVPGMGHCSGGPGTDLFDKVGVLEQWVEHGTAPDKIIAAHRTKGVEDMTRPLCPYPEVAKWKGPGSTNAAANFVCVMKDKQ